MRHGPHKHREVVPRLQRAVAVRKRPEPTQVGSQTLAETAAPHPRILNLIPLVVVGVLVLVVRTAVDLETPGHPAMAVLVLHPRSRAHLSTTAVVVAAVRMALGLIRLTGIQPSRSPLEWAARVAEARVGVSPPTYPPIRVWWAEMELRDSVAAVVVLRTISSQERRTAHAAVLVALG